MLSQDPKELVNYANTKHSELVHNFTVFCEAARNANHDLKHSGIKVDFKEKYLHAHFLDEELIFKYKPVIYNDSLIGMISVLHCETDIHHCHTVTPVSEIYFDHHGNVLDSKDMNTRDLTMNDAYRLVIEAASKLLNSVYFRPANYTDS
jgi:hypothetical protein